MADKEARVRLTLKNGDFLSAMQNTAHDVTRINQKMESSLKGAMSGAASAAKNSVGKIRGELAGIAKLGIGLGGAFEMGSAIKGAMEMQGEYKKLAFKVEAATGFAVKYQVLQEEIEASAMKWSRKNNEVADSFDEIFTKTGNSEYAINAMDSVAMAAQAAKEPMSAFSGIAAQLNKVFGVTAEQLPNALAAVTSLRGKGADLDELSSMFERAGASAKVLGMQGADGIARFSAMLTILKSSGMSTRQATAGLNQFMAELASPDAMKGIEKSLATITGKSVHLVNKRGVVADDALLRIMKATHGDQGKLQQIFKGTSGAALMGGLGGVFKEKGASEFNAALIEMGQSTVTVARMEKEAAKNNESAGSSMKRALNELENEFTRPEMMKALKEMAHIMPMVAHGAAQLLNMVISHPYLGGAAVVGGKVALDAAGGFATPMAQALGRKIIAEIMGQKVTVVAKPIVDGLGMTIGKEFVTVAAAATPWTNAGKLMAQTAGVGIAAYLALEAGKWIIDKAVESKADDQRTAALGMAASGTNDPAQMVPRLKQAREALKVAEAESRATSGMATGMGGMPGGMPAGGGEVIETHEIKALRATISELEGSLGKLTKSSKDASGALDKVKKSGGAASNGLTPPSGNDPGAE